MWNEFIMAAITVITICACSIVIRTVVVMTIKVQIKDYTKEFIYVEPKFLWAVPMSQQ